jgi:hypothetical protein
MRLTVKDLSIEEFANLEREIRDSHVDTAALSSTWQSLNIYFKDALPEDIEKFKWTYFRIYTELSWKMFGSQSRDFVVNMAIKNQIPMALSLEFDVLNEMLSYLSLRTFDNLDMQGLYLKIKKAFLESDFQVGNWQGNKVRLSDLVKEIRMISNKSDSLEQAEFENKLRQILFFSDPIAATYIEIQSNEAVQRFIDLVMFFDAIDENKITPVINSLSIPENFQNVISEQQEVKGGSVENPEEAELQNLEEWDADIDLAAGGEALIMLTPQQIKSQIESEFKKDNEGNFEDIDAVMRKLEEFTEMYNDPKIADLIYFDEEEDRFKWKI